MSAAQHTPGPWEVVNGIDVYPVGDTSARFYVANCDPDDAPLQSAGFAPGEHDDTDSTFEQQAANARLIAAAPDLLAALKSFCDADAAYYGPQIRVDCDSHGDALKRMRVAREAIARAEGRS